MKTVTVSVVEGKKDFTRLVREAAEKNKDIVVTKRGKPMAVIVPYDEYRRSKKMEAYKKILEARAAFVKTGVSAAEVHRQSKAELERRG